MKLLQILAAKGGLDYDALASNLVIVPLNLSGIQKMTATCSGVMQF